MSNTTAIMVKHSFSGQVLLWSMLTASFITELLFEGVPADVFLS